MYYSSVFPPLSAQSSWPCRGLIMLSCPCVCTKHSHHRNRGAWASLSDPRGLSGPGPKAFKTNFPLAASGDEGASPYTYRLPVCLHCLDYCQDYSPSSDSRAFLRRSRAAVVIAEGDGEVMLGYAESVFMWMYVCARSDICSANSSERVYGGVTPASALCCHGNCSRFGLLGSKEERRDDLQCFRGGRRGRKVRKKEQSCHISFLSSGCFSITLHTRYSTTTTDVRM